MRTAESLFREFFLGLYPPGDLEHARSEDANPAKNPAIYGQLDEIAAVLVKNAPVALGVELDFTDASVHRLSKALAERREQLFERGDFANVVIHAAVYVGACIVKNHGGEWLVRRPLWESLVRLSSDAGVGDLAVFHWLLKSLADDAPASLADRYRANVEVPRGALADLPVIAPTDRRLPKLAKPSYHALHQYLKAHVPEVRDVGVDFPSPERWDELGLESLTMHLVGGGRLLAMAGPSKAGLHAFWLSHAGFVKSAFWPCDAFPAPIFRVADERKIEVVLSVDGAMRSFELLWWGP